MVPRASPSASAVLLGPVQPPAGLGSFPSPEAPVLSTSQQCFSREKAHDDGPMTLLSSSPRAHIGECPHISPVPSRELVFNKWSHLSVCAVLASGDLDLERAGPSHLATALVHWQTRLQQQCPFASGSEVLRIDL